MLKDFEYEDDGKRAVLAAGSDEALDKARALVSELKMCLGTAVVILGVKAEGGTATLTWCTRETFETTHDEKGWVLEFSTRVYEQDRTAGTRTLTTYIDGDKNVREHGKGTLEDFFGEDSCNWPGKTLFVLLRRKGYDPDKVEIIQYYWENLALKYNYEENESQFSSADKDLPFNDGWKLSEDEDIEWIGQRICLYTRGDKRVYTRTDKDELRGKKNVCEVFTTFGEFLKGPCGDLDFDDTPENRELFIKALNHATDMSEIHPESREQTFIEVLREKMPKTTLSEEEDE